MSRHGQGCPGTTGVEAEKRVRKPLAAGHGHVPPWIRGPVTEGTKGRHDMARDGLFRQRMSCDPFRDESAWDSWDEFHRIMASADVACDVDDDVLCDVVPE